MVSFEYPILKESFTVFKELPISSRTENRGTTRSTIHGLGVNDAPYQTTIKVNGVPYTCPYFSRWKVMLDRCYSKGWLRKHPTYAYCEVAPEWHSFMAFKHWMMTQDWQGKQLDKDLLSLDKKVYSPNTCLFVTRQVNSLFNERNNAQGALPLGIYARNGKYEVGVSKGNAKRSWVGRYHTVPDAIDAYVKAKLEVVAEVCRKEKDPKVRQAIQKYSKYFADKLLLLKTAY